MSDSRARGAGFDTQSGRILLFLLVLIQEGQLSVTGKSMCTYLVLVDCLGGLSLPRNSMVRLTDDHPDITLAFYHGCKLYIVK